MVYIYTLSTEEEPNNIRYVGKTNDLHRRLKRHLSNYYLNEQTYKSNWLKSEIKKGNTPIINILDEVDDSNWQFWETYWIEQIKSWGMNLTNGTKGGEGIVLTKKVIERRNLSNKNSEKRKLAYSNYKFSLKSYNDAVNKFNVIKDGDTFTGSRHCPSCKKEVLYSSTKETNLMNCLRRAEKEKRICISCKSSGEKNYFFGKKLNDGELKKERYGKKVLQCDLDGNVIQEYKSIREASSITKIDRKSISNCCKKIKHYNTAGGFKFKFK